MKVKKILLQELKKPGDMYEFPNMHSAEINGETYRVGAAELAHLRQIRNNLPFDIQIIQPFSVRYGYRIIRKN